MGAPSRARSQQALVGPRHGLKSVERSIIAYWVIAALLGALFLGDWLTQWNVPATLAQPWLVALLVVTWLAGTLCYAAVARHDNRPLHWATTLVFIIGNGICETLAFALVYRLGETIGSGLMGLIVPAWTSAAGFGGGILLFIAYGGLIHVVFWLNALPPHLDDSPRSRLIRKWRPLTELGLVLGWSLCFWLTRDIWTVVFFHILVDLGLMLLVRPQLFWARGMTTQAR